MNIRPHLTINTNLTLDYDIISIYSGKHIIVQSGVSRIIKINTSDYLPFSCSRKILVRSIAATLSASVISLRNTI
ncbi:MAG: hypothetical protein ACK570_01630 [Bacteroidota bacterium]